MENNLEIPIIFHILVKKYIKLWGMYLAWMAGQVDDKRALKDKNVICWRDDNDEIISIILPNDINFSIVSFMNSLPSDNGTKRIILLICYIVKICIKK